MTITRPRPSFGVYRSLIATSGQRKATPLDAMPDPPTVTVRAASITMAAAGVGGHGEDRRY